MKRSDAFPSSYMSKDDLVNPLILTIAYVKIADLKSEHGEEKKPVMGFMEQEVKNLVLNNWNWGICEDAFGQDSDNWTGKKIEAYVDPSVMFGGKRVGGIRLRLPGNMANVAVWSFQQAISELEKVGLNKEDLITRLKNLGQTGYKPDRDTATVRNMIAEQANKEESFGDPGDSRPAGEEIPF